MRLTALIASVILILITLNTVDSYNDGQRLLNEGGLEQVQKSDVKGEAVAAGRAVKITPFWLVICHGTGSTLAVFGLMIALAMGRSPAGRVAALAMVAIGVTMTWSPSDLFNNFENLTVSQMGEESAPLAYFGQQLLTCLLFLSPPVVLWFYYASPLLDRYVLTGVFAPLLLCFVGLIAIWIIMDLTDNGRDFISAGAGMGLLGRYYLVQMPQIVLMVLPITLLLALLFSLGRMSRTNEIVSMLGFGLSMGRILTPLLIAGFLCSLICVVLKYEWAPNADARKEGILNLVSDLSVDKRKGNKSSSDDAEWLALAWLYRNILTDRTWFVGRVPIDLATGEMRYVAVWWQTGTGKVFRTYRAHSVSWDHETKTWTFKKCTIYEFDEFGTALITNLPLHEIPDWAETPWHVVSSSYKAEYLGVQGLTTYIRSNARQPPAKLAPYRTRWHHSWAEPFRCFFIVLMAAPLGIVHSRRGVLSGVAGAIVIFFGLIFLDGVFLALGESGRAPAWLGAWGPNLILGVIGAALFYIRANDKEPPKLSNLRNLFAKA